MTTTYATWKATPGNVKFPIEGGLVLGWQTDQYEAKTETHYALFESGRVLQSVVTYFNSDFDPRGAEWSEVAEVPADAVFIGYYKPPKV